MPVFTVDDLFGWIFLAEQYFLVKRNCKTRQGVVDNCLYRGFCSELAALGGSLSSDYEMFKDELLEPF